MKKNKNAFTLVELLAVIAILAVILIIAVPMILGVIEDAKVKSFRLSVLGAFDAIELEYARKGTTGGNLSDLPIENNPFLTGTWNFEESTGDITMVDVSDGTYEVEIVASQDGEEFEVTKNGVSTGNPIKINGDNPISVNCSKTETYTDEGAKYESTNLTTMDTVDLTKAGTYQLHYNHGRFSATRIVNVKNENEPILNISETTVTITKGDTFDANSYIVSASDPCEGDITSKVQSVSEVLTDVAGTYTVTYKVKNLGNVETTKELQVTILELSQPEVEIPTVPTPSGWFDENPEIVLPTDDNLDGYEYAISTDGGTTWSEYKPVEGTNVPIDQEGNNVVIKIRGKRGDKYTEPTISEPMKVDLLPPDCVSSGGNTNWVTSLTITGTCSDTVSGCASPTVTKAFTTNTNTTTASPGSVSDNAGHTTVCPANQTVKVDAATPGAPTMSGASTTWTSGNRTFTATAPSSSSGISGYEYYVSNSNSAPAASQAATGTGLTVSQNGKFVFFRAVNNAGTKGAWTAAQNLYIDKTTPGAPTMSGASTTWTSGNRTFTVTAPSSSSGIKNYEYYVSNSNSVPAASQAATGTGLTVSTTGKFAFFRAVNNAGTKGAWTAAQNLYVDKATPGAPGVSGASTSWAQSRTFTMTAPSSTSGIKSYEYYVSASNSAPNASTAASGSSTTTSVVVNKTGKFAFFRAINNAGTKGAWTAVQNSYVDIGAPSLSRKVASYSQKKGASYAVTNFYTVSYGVSGGTTTCKVGSTTVTNLSTLAAGSHTLSCTATSGAGKATSAISISVSITNPTYLVDSVNVGDYVGYDAGKWTSSAAEPTTHGAFGGYTAGTSKNYGGSSAANQGWRVLSKSGSGSSGTVTLIHAGVPEQAHFSSISSSVVNTLNNRANQYLNSTYATSGRSVNCADAQVYVPQACVKNDLYDYDFLPDILIGGDYYWLASTNNSKSWRVNSLGNVSNQTDFSLPNDFGFRPIIVLKAGIFKTGGSGTSSSPYSISI